MAFKKTSGRSVFVQPTGMPNLSGFSKAASTWQDVAKVGHSIGADMRKQKLNKLILTAEAEGRTAGATYDKDNNLVPITNLNTGTAIEQQVFGTGEKETLRAAYRQSAIKTYTASVSQDTKSFVANLLLEDPSNPDKIRGSLEGYIEGLGIDDDVKSYVMPDIVSRFVTAENQAAANQKIAVDKNTELVNTAHITDLFQRLSVLSANGPLESGNGLEGQLKMEEELRNDIEGSYQALESIGYTEAQIDAIDKAGNQIIQEQSLIGHIERVYISSGRDYAASLLAIEEIQENLENTTDFDAKVITDGMTSHLTDLRNIHVAEINQNKINNDKISDNISLGITLGSVTKASQVLSLDIPEAKKNSLLKQLISKQDATQLKNKTIASNMKAGWTDDFENLMVSMKNTNDDPETVNQQQQDSIEIQSMINSSRLTGLQIAQFQKESNRIANAILDKKANLAWADLRSQMGPQSNYSLTVSDLRKQTKRLLDMNLIGDDSKKGQVSLKTWEGMISSYETEKKTYDKKVQKLVQARRRLLDGTSPTPAADAKLVADAEQIALAYDEEGRAFDHSDGEIASQNVDTAIRFSIANNALHPSIAESLKGLEGLSDNAEAFNTRIFLFESIFDSLSKGTISGGVTDYGMGDIAAQSFMSRHGVDVSDYLLAKQFGIKDYNEIKSIKETDNSERITRNLDSQFGGARQAIKDNWHAAVEGRSFREFVLNNTLFPSAFHTPDKATLNMLARISNSVPDSNVMTGDIEDAYINDENLLNLLEASVMRQFATKNYPVTPEGVQIAIKHAITKDLGEDFVSISVDSDGMPYWTTSSWYKDAVSSIGDNQYDGSVSEIVFDDIRYKATSQGSSLMDEETSRLLSNGGIISLAPNALKGRGQSYRVMLTDPDDEYNVRTIMPHYKFDYSSSPMNGAMIAAEVRGKNSTLIEFIKSFPLIGGVMSRSMVKGQAENIIDDLENDANYAGVFEPEQWTGLLELMQSVNDAVNPFYNSAMDKRYDAGDVKLLRSFLAGHFTEKEFKEELGKYYE